MVKRIITSWVGGCGGAVHQQRVSKFIDEIQKKGHEVTEVKVVQKAPWWNPLSTADDITDIIYS